MTSDAPDPWEELTPPETVEAFAARRIGADCRWRLFWALDARGQRLLMLQHDPSIGMGGPLPRFRGLVAERLLPEGEPALLVIRLIRSEFWDVFQHFCTDAVRVTEQAQTEREAVGRFVARAWLWQRFLASGKDGRLSDEEQKGLLGELTVLSDILAPTLGMAEAIAAWTGPLGAPKDFEIGRNCVESKAFSGGSATSVRIASADQLSTTALDELFLVVSEVAPTFADGGVTLAGCVASVQRSVESQAPEAREAFESRLAAVGFDPADDYSDRRWQMGARWCFRVGAGFPRITPEQCPSGVHHVRYRIALAECEPFRVAERALRAAVGGRDAHQS